MATNYTIVVEYRPLLRVCHFFIKIRLHQHEATITVEETKVVIKQSLLVINVQVPNNIRLCANSLSGVCFLEDSLYFRTTTNPERLKGSYALELFEHKQKKIPSLIYKPDVKINEDVKIYCRACARPLTEMVQFSRVLPLPSAGDASDFFCHAHSDTSVSLDPKPEDIFYGSYYFNINASLVNCMDGAIKCGRCGYWLGTKNKKHAQFWNSTTGIGPIPQEQSCDICLIDFLSIIKNASSETIGPTTKLIAYCNIFGERTEYLLLWILDKELILLVSENDPYPEQTLLNEKTVTKLLYKHETERTPTVKKWEQADAAYIPITPSMLTQAVEYLKSMALNIPKDYRKTEDMNISYLALEERC